MIVQGPVVVRGGGDIATGTICRLRNCGFEVVVLESAAPTAIRRGVALSEAVYDGSKTVEGVTARRIENPGDCRSCWAEGVVPLLVDPGAGSLAGLRPAVVVDAILAKRNCGTGSDMAPVTIGLGPGFSAGKDVHAVIETARGHQLGRIIYSGEPLPDSGIPGEIGGHSLERVVYAPREGDITVFHDIGSRVQEGDVIAETGSAEVKAPLSGLVRGMIRSGTRVWEGMKISDIDPRPVGMENCFTISDKARCISGGVVEAIMVLALKSPGLTKTIF